MTGLQVSGGKMNWTRKSILVTGGTGSFGKKFIEIMLNEYHPKRLVVFSRDELKQHEMVRDKFNHDSLRYFIGDIRDRDRLKRAMQDIDIVIHAAALKQVPACEYNPMEAVNTNIIGTKNVIDAALDSKVDRVLMLSTDKAVNPVNLYGATKLAAEKLFIQSNAYSGRNGTRFSCVRYGNVLASRGSVIPVFMKQRSEGAVTVTDARMTRFWLTLEQAVQFVIQSVECMTGGEVFVPKIPSMKIMDIARAIAPECEIRFMGIRPGEKLHESLISRDEAGHVVENDNKYIIMPLFTWWKMGDYGHTKSVPDGFSYTSENNSEVMTHTELLTIAEQMYPERRSNGNGTSKQTHSRKNAVDSLRTPAN